jgi:predicted DNA-binding transcriptional regulator AlpA
MEALLNTREVASILRLSEDWVKHMRVAGHRSGPSFVKIGRLVRYRRSDVARFLNRHIVRVRRA